MKVALALLTVLLSGCFFGWGHCDFTATDAHWQDETLWDELDVDIDLPEGWATGDPMVVIRHLSWRHGDLEIFTQGDDLRTHVRGEANETDLRAAARGLLQNATDMSANQISAEVEAFIASYERYDEGTHYHDGEPMRVDVGNYHHEIQLDGAILVQNLGLALDQVHEEDDNYSIHFTGATKSTKAGDLRIQVDLFGEVTANYGWPEGVYDDEVKAHIRKNLEEAGMNVPDADDIEVQGYIC